MLERHPRIDLLVNNAGIAGPRAFVGADPERDRAHVRDELPRLGLVPARVPAGARATGSHVVNIVSVAGTVAYGPYSASKHAQLAFSRTVAVELAARGISRAHGQPRLRRDARLPAEGPVPVPARPGARRRAAARRRADPRAVEHDQREIVVPRWYAPAGWAQALVPGIVARVPGRLPHCSTTTRRARVGPLSIRDASSYVIVPATRACSSSGRPGPTIVTGVPARQLAVELDGEGVHRDRPDDAAALALDEHLGAGQVAAEAVRVADRDDADPRVALGDEAAAVAGRVAGRSSFTSASSLATRARARARPPPRSVPNGERP